MGFLAEFIRWLDEILQGYISNTTATIAGVLEPAIVTLATLYVVVWGYLHLMGRIEEPFVTGIKRLVTMAVVLGISLSLWHYNEIIVDTFFIAPSVLAAQVIGPHDAISVVDGVLAAGNEVAGALSRRAGILALDFSFYVASLGVQIIVGITAVYTMFLIVLSRIALSVLLALGPFFIALLFFETTKKFFESWIAQLANYAFITILTGLVAALMLTVLTRAAEHAISAGGSVQVADAIRLCVAAGLTLLVMRQVMPIAAGLASGLALSSFGVVSAAMAWGLGTASRNTREFGRGLMDRETHRTDSLTRKAGYYTRRKLWGPRAQ
ncbi:type IV secretion system protein [Steroidobacter sp. S1-65]|uniref:Type IV secretion system protein n=1 Tax=Steroidobacter gossypii TaxID=2805490 RepID=A0ABS1X6L8_9GAMM|nr:type IV secretion system protein [Steroidobacter gossypii]MBM0108869.1 type IV secretion system protein [Steroidobacter gossypii]